MREYVVASGRLVPATGIDRGPMLLGDATRWLDAFRQVRVRENVRFTLLRFVPLMAIAGFLMLLGAWELGLGLFLLLIGITVLGLRSWNYMLATRPINHYRSSGHSPGLYANGLELHAFIMGFRRVLPFGHPVWGWMCTLFMPYTECLDFDFRYRPLISFFQDTVHVRLRGGKYLAFPAGFLGEDGLELFRTLVARGPPRAEAPRLVLYGPAGEMQEWSEVSVPGASAPDRQRR